MQLWEDQSAVQISYSEFLIRHVSGRFGRYHCPPASAVPEGLQVLVEDNGVGMQPEELARLGELFFRGDDEIVLNTKGYGLGIPIAMECVKLCNGRLFYSSEKGVGSKFGIIVPAMS